MARVAKSRAEAQSAAIKYIPKYDLGVCESFGALGGNRLVTA